MLLVIRIIVGIHISLFPGSLKGERTFVKQPKTSSDEQVLHPLWNRSISVLHYFLSSKLDYNRCHPLPVQFSASKSKSPITYINLVSSLLVSIFKFLYFAAVTLNIFPVVDQDSNAIFHTIFWFFKISLLNYKVKSCFDLPKNGNSNM